MSFTVVFPLKLDRVENDFVYFVVDETTDITGCYVKNLLIDSLNQKRVTKSYLISSNVLDKTIILPIVRFINDALTSFSFSSCSIN